MLQGKNSLFLLFPIAATENCVVYTGHKSNEAAIQLLSVVCEHILYTQSHSSEPEPQG